MAAFSRLQLAAALIEYDNDLSNPAAPFRSAHDSAVFAHLRRAPGARPSMTQRRSDYLGVSMPSETGSAGGRESAMGTRRSRGSIDALRNPFGADDVGDEEEPDEHEDLEVDLTSWGLDAFMPKDKDTKGKGKARASTLPLQHPSSLTPGAQPRSASDNIPRRPSGLRTRSLGNMDSFAAEAAVEASTSDNLRRRSFGTPLDLDGVEASFERPPQSPPERTGPQMIPFPSRSARSPSPANDLDRADNASIAPRQRRDSNGTVQTGLLGEDNPFALNPPTNASRFDPKAALHARTRTVSNGSLGTRMMLDNDAMSTMTGQPNKERPYSTVELLRPKVLVMPSPLQSVPGPRPPSPAKARDGFEISGDGKPLPPGARTAARRSILNPPIASNSFTPNPRASLTLSQLTFRNQLMIDGQRDVAYADLDNALPRATEEGEQVPNLAIEDISPDVPMPLDESGVRGRPAGKLFGKSLIDDLETRKNAMRNKKRVFYGDERPSMMARGQLQRSSTLIDPASLQTRPVVDRSSSYGIPPAPGGLTRSNSNVKPLLNFDGEDLSPRPGPKVINSRSVFGVDQLWEREVAKLREIEEQERLEEEERERLEALKPKKKGKGGKKKGKGQAVEEPLSPAIDPEVMASPPLPRVSAEPPMLPNIPKAIRGPPPPHLGGDSESEESDDEMAAKTPAPAQADGWYAGSSDDEGKKKGGVVRTTGTGPRYRAPSDAAPKLPGIGGDDSDDEDLPLAATLGRAVQRISQRRAADSDSDEDTPLAAVMTKSQLGSPTRARRPSAADGDDDDEDNEPLGLRASRIPLGAGAGGGDDDDTPLAFHPEQQRRTQYQMLAQAQVQHQQLMMQAQATNSMFFNPSMMGSGFFGPPMASPAMMMAPPAPMPSPPPLNDANKYGRVDRWRRDVAVEGGGS
ncbi:hypothetical protein HGRIS_009985 [Hohenbuehelia grisea]|uniref:Uncharacterized protein n=1 Tax=Hohenbuehelia grisea TaxID=104357 RepID=A0ABR3J3C4_9AGAR